MRKVLTLIFAVLILAGCAGTQKTAYVIPDHIKKRPILLIEKRLHECMDIEYRAKATKLLISADKQPNAMTDGEKVILTEGLFKYDDKTLAFIMAHEFSHMKLNHRSKRAAVSYGTTAAFIVAGFFVPGIGYANHLVNPAVTNNYSKTQEYDADKMAWETCQKCFRFDEKDQFHILTTMKANAGGGGGFWDTHPAWEDRIKNISQPPQ